VWDIPIQAGIEQAGLYSNFLIFLIALCTLPFFVRRSFGAPAAMIATLLMAFATPFSAHLGIGQADHHGLIALTLIVGTLLFSKGLFLELFPSRQDLSTAMASWSATRFMILSGATLGAALWMSAATAIQFLAFMGIASFFAFLPGTGKPQNSPEMQRYIGDKCRLLRCWAFAGGASSLLFYLLEYFPNDLGFRLEVNHPLYSLAFCAGGVLLTRVLEWRHGIESPWRTLSRGLGTVLALAFAMLPFLVISLFRSQVFLLSDPFLWELHKTEISEFQTVPAMVTKHGCQRTYFVASRA
jgi:hypothetical protein